jgi:hypothetical protein
MVRKVPAVKVALVASLVLSLPGEVAFAEPHQCMVVDTEFTPAAPDLQVVVWLEDSAGKYIDTLYITQLTGTFGLGNRPGVKNFKSAWHWPYGRREFVFPIWAHRHGKTFPKLLFQDLNDTGLSHSMGQSSVEPYFCRPLAEGEPQWDSQTCASAKPPYTDKGQPSASETSLYPPRADAVFKKGVDDPAVATFNEMNPFDAVSQATPIGHMDFKTSWLFPPELPAGNYVVYVETSQEWDFNGTYNPDTLPPVPLDSAHWGDYGLPAQGQPSVVYRVPITIDRTGRVATTSSYAGYGDANGDDGVLHVPDATITTDTPGTGASRFQLTDDGAGGTFRVRVAARPQLDEISPAPVGAPDVVQLDDKTVTLDFTEPGDDGLVGEVSGFEVRYRAVTPMDEGNFMSSMPVAATLAPRGPGNAQTITLDRLLPQIDDYVGIRAYDECKNYGPLVIKEVTTAARQTGYVDACFVATAAYGSMLANDVEMLRRFRDVYLESNVLGELAVETYYSVGPAVAGVVDQSEPLRGTARDILQPIVDTVRRLAPRR